jgi:hypothetical protein
VAALRAAVAPHAGGFDAARLLAPLRARQPALALPKKANGFRAQ